MKTFLNLAALVMVVVPAPLFAQEARWPLEESVKSPTKALSIPTKLDPMMQSLTDILNAGGKVVSSYVGTTGPIVTVQLKKAYRICLLRGANPATDANVPTSECYALN